MRKKNGMTMVELLISLCIISIVIALLFNILIEVRTEDLDNQIESIYILNQSSLIKEIESDMINYGVKEISNCNITDANVAIDALNKEYEKQFKCVKLIYSSEYINDNIGYILIYNSYGKYDVINGNYQGKDDTARWIIQYLRGNYQRFSKDIPISSSWRNTVHVLKQYPEGVNLKENPYVLYTSSPDKKNVSSLIIPIIDNKKEHYDINLAFTFNGNNEFKCHTTNSNKFACKCLSDEESCNITYN